MKNPDYYTKRRRAQIARDIRKRVLRDRYDVAADIADALCDLRHLCDARGLVFADLDGQAYDHYIAEATR